MLNGVCNWLGHWTLPLIHPIPLQCPDSFSSLSLPSPDYTPPNFQISRMPSHQRKIGNPTPVIHDCTQPDNSKCTFHSLATITLTQLFCSHLPLHNTRAYSAFLPAHSAPSRDLPSTQVTHTLNFPFPFCSSTHSVWTTHFGLLK